jgi:hypothetical protein
MCNAAKDQERAEASRKPDVRERGKKTCHLKRYARGTQYFTIKICIQLHNYLTIYEEMYLNLHKTYEKFR